MSARNLKLLWRAALFNVVLIGCIFSTAAAQTEAGGNAASTTQTGDTAVQQPTSSSLPPQTTSTNQQPNSSAVASTASPAAAPAAGLPSLSSFKSLSSLKSLVSGGSFSLSGAKQLFKGLFQNMNASPDDVYVFPAVLGPVSSTDLPNFHQVETYLYRGGAPTDSGFKILQKMGIKTVVDLRSDANQTQKEKQTVQSLGMRYINLPVSKGIPQQQYQERFYYTVEDASEKPNQGSIFVHCDFGCDRTGYMIGMWRVRHDHWSKEDALQEMLKYGYLVHLAGPEQPRVRAWLSKLEQNNGLVK